MKFKSRDLLCTFLLALTFSLSGCGITKNQEKIYNDNSKITQSGDSYTYIIRNDKESANEKIDIKYRSFSGTDTIWTINCKEKESITLEYNSIVTSGDFKVVLISPKDDVEIILEGNKEDKSSFSLEEGKYTLKLVGRKAKGEVKISISKSDKVDIIKQRSR